MKRLLTLLLLVSFGFSLFGQEKIPRKEINSIVEEGNMLYRCEQSTWNGLNLVLQIGIQKSAIKGFFSRVLNDTTYWICYSKGNTPKVIASIAFYDSTLSVQKAKINLNTREFTNAEKELYTMNEQAIKYAHTATSTIRSYDKTTMRSIPIIYNGVRKVYILTLPDQPNRVVFGNDYLITLDKLFQVKSVKLLHNEAMSLNYKTDSSGLKETYHSHNEKTGDLITPTDICILMLYGKETKWKQHLILTPNFVYTWDCEAHRLSVSLRKNAKKALRTQKPTK